MADLVKSYTSPAETVLDPFMGSGTTGVACVQAGRKFVGVEIDETYYAVAKRRIEEAEGVGSLFDPRAVVAPDLFAGESP